MMEIAATTKQLTTLTQCTNRLNCGHVSIYVDGRLLACSIYPSPVSCLCIAAPHVFLVTIACFVGSGVPSYLISTRC